MCCVAKLFTEEDFDLPVYVFFFSTRVFVCCTVDAFCQRKAPTGS